jgi:hypothetical protein
MFGLLELKELTKILNALIKDGPPSDFYMSGMHPMFNMNSGNVFLTNEDYQVAMLNGDKLESFYSCPICGHEGFREDMSHGEDDEECREFVLSLGEAA